MEKLSEKWLMTGTVAPAMMTTPYYLRNNPRKCNFGLHEAN